ncbi:MAG: carbohydrate ABC transporter permease [Dictyoglomaceae bacterium]
MNRKINPGVFYLLPVMFFIIIIFLVPLVYSVGSSFTRWLLLRPDLGMKFIGFANYLRLFKDIFTWQTIGRTFYFIFGAVFVEIIVGFIIALALNTEFKGWKIVQSVILVPFMIAPIVVGFTWKFILDNNFGLIPYILKAIGLGKIIENVPLLANPKMAMPMIIIADAWEYIPVVTLIILAGLKSLPIELYEAANVDGATSLQKFKYITLPILRPVLLVAIVMRTLTSLQVFDSIYVMTGGGPGSTTETLSFYTYREAFVSYDIGFSSALNVLIILLAMVFTLIYMRIIGGKSE